MDIEKSIRTGLAIRKMTPADVRKCVNKSAQTVSYWMNNKSNPTLSDLEKLAKLFEVKVSTFIEWGEE